MAIKLVIDKTQLKNRDLITLDRMARAPRDMAYEDMLRFLQRFVVDEIGQPVPEEQAWEALLDLSMAETMAAVESIKASLDGLRAEAVPQPTGSR